MNKIEIISGLIGVYEIFARAIPTRKNWSIVHGIFKALIVASNFLNVKKGDNTKLPGLPLLCVVIATSLFSCSTLKRTQIDCLSKKEVHVTLIDKHGNPYTFHTTYCDTIRVDVLPDTTKVKQ